MKYKLILASNSPRRRELIKNLDLPFKCMSVNADETSNFTSPSKIAMEISRRKAIAAYELHNLKSNEIIISADTIVVINNQILGKPKDDNHARIMLQELQGKVHYVYTGVTFIYIPQKNNSMSPHKIKTFYEKTKVKFNPISQKEIEDYIQTGDHKDKAGSYAIQGEFSKHISGIQGDYNNVVGFPVSRIYKELKDL